MSKRIAEIAPFEVVLVPELFEVRRISTKEIIGAYESEEEAQQVADRESRQVRLVYRGEHSWVVSYASGTRSRGYEVILEPKRPNITCRRSRRCTRLGGAPLQRR